MAAGRFQQEFPAEVLPTLSESEMAKAQAANDMITLLSTGKEMLPMA
jgi:hypothetical protein